MTGILLFTVAVLALVVLALAFVRDAAASKRLGSQEAPDKMDTTQVITRELPNRLVRLLRTAGIQLPLSVVVIGAIIMAAVAAWIIFIWSYGAWAPCLVVFFLLLFLLYSVISEVARSRAIKFEEKLCDAVDLLANALTAGELPAQAMQTVAGYSPEPVKGEFLQVVHNLEVGMDIRRALNRLLTYYDSEGVRMLVSTLSAQWSAGWKMGPVLKTVSEVMRERLQYRLRVRSQMSGAQVSAFILGLAPYILMFALYMIMPEWLVQIFQHPTGRSLFWSAVVLQLLGFTMIFRIMRVEL